MSWDADFYVRTVEGTLVHYWDANYTHNVNRMANTALGYDTPASVGEEVLFYKGPTWWQQLNGLDGKTATPFLDSILTKFNAEPETYRAMNPDNGWGDFDSFRTILERMRDLSEEFPNGEWSVRG